MKYNNFHATLGDLTPRLEQIESRFSLKYIPIGWQKSASGDIFSSVFAIPDFGTSVGGIGGDAHASLRLYSGYQFTMAPCFAG